MDAMLDEMLAFIDEQMNELARKKTELKQSARKEDLCMRAKIEKLFDLRSVNHMMQCVI